jgi:uncharacterized protein (TIGR02646 family)
MIRVTRPEQAPRILRERGQRTTEQNQSAFEAGTRTFEFDSSLYGAKSVKNALIGAQHGKCAFCEAKIRHIDHGDVEHLRPKGGFRQSTKDPLEQPGYFWLAYAWANLFLACSLCNQSFKRNLFPLVDPARRARSHLDDVAAEEPLLIDPAKEDPATLIGFRQEVAFPIDGQPRARITIEILGLNRVELAEHRLDRLRKIRVLRDLLHGLAGNPNEAEQIRQILEEAREILEEATKANAEYASMARWLLERRL